MTPRDIVLAFLKALEARDLATASSFLAPGAVLTFPTARTFTSLEQLVAWAKDRYKEVRKSFDAFDEFEQGGVTTIYVHGKLSGTWLDGRPISNVRYLDRFDIKGGKIVRQDVWNDLAEFRV
jgi:hypothetical protein